MAKGHNGSGSTATANRVKGSPKGEEQEHLVSIVHQNGCCKVEPAVIHVNPGDAIFWKFDGSAGGGMLFFPKEELFEEKPPHVIPSEADGELHLTVKKVIKRGRHPYATYCAEHNCFAVGNSDPRIDYP